MAGINKVIIIGNIGRDPELRYTKSDTAVVTISVATTRGVKRGEEWVDETEWHRVTVWGKDAEYVNKYGPKGRQIYVEGRLHTRKYEDKDGKTCYSTDVVAETVQLLGRSGSDQRESADERTGREESRASDRQQQKRSGGGHASGGGSRQQGGGGGGKSGGRRAADDGGDSFDSYIPDAPDDDIPFAWAE